MVQAGWDLLGLLFRMPRPVAIKALPAIELR